jgi:colicin import membrane protein
MIEPALKRTALLSAILHLMVFILAITLTQRSSRLRLPSAYTVRLVSPVKISTVKKRRVAKKIVPKKTVVKKSVSNNNKTTLRKSVTPEKGPERIHLKEQPARRSGITAVKPSAKGSKDKRELKKAEVKKKAAEDLSRVKEKIASLQAKRASIERIRKRIRLRETALETVLSIRKGEAGSIQPGVVEKEARPEKPLVEGEALLKADDFMSSYYMIIQNKIWSEWVFPDFRKDEPLEAIIRIKILKDGRVVTEGFEKRSGDKLFDRSVLRAVTKASPLPPPPYEMAIGLRFIP